MNQQALEQPTALERSPEVVSGVLRFRSTRVPVAALFEIENLRDGATVALGLAWFPRVTKAHVDDILECEIHALRGEVRYVGGKPSNASPM